MCLSDQFSPASVMFRNDVDQGPALPAQRYQQDVVLTQKQRLYFAP
jgi:hypothetical protein